MNFQLKAPRIPHLSVVEQVFVNRGIPADEVTHYLNTSQADVIDPATITNMETGAKMLVSHIAQGHKVLVQIDSDCDGFTSAAVLINYLNCLSQALCRTMSFIDLIQTRLTVLFRRQCQVM